MNKKLENEEIIEKLKSQRTESLEMTRESREEASKNKRYFKGNQLSDDVVAHLSSEGRPIEWENIIKKIANKIMGLKLLSKQEVNAFARQTNDKPSANIITNILRASQDSTQFWSYKKRADFDLLMGGVSVMKPVIKELGEIDTLGVNERDLNVYHVPLENAYFDPYSTSPDGSDSRYFHEVRLLEKSELYEFFDAKLVDQLEVMNDELNQYSAVSAKFSQRVRITVSWYCEYDRKQKRKIYYYAIWGDNVLLEHKESPYDMKRIPVSIRKVYDVDAEDPTAFYSPFRDIIPLQDKINFTHLRIANMLGTIKLLFESDAVEDAETFVNEYSYDDATVEVKSGAISGNKIKEIKHSNEIAQLMNIIYDKRKQAEDIIGLNNEILGTSVQRLSGYAIEHRQNAGMVGLQMFIDSSLEQDKDIAIMGVSLINQYINAEQIYRMVDSFEADDFFIANEIEKTSDGRVVYEDGKAKRKNKLEIGRFDLILKSVPQSRGSIGERQKNWVEIMKLFAGNAPVMQELLPRMLRDIESPVANEVLEIIKKEQEAKANNEAVHEQQQLKAKGIQLEMEKMQAEIKKLQSVIDLNNANANKINKENGVSA